MDSATDSRIAAFKRFVEEANGLCHQLNTAEHDEFVADDTAARLANPGKGDDVEHLRRFRAGLGDIAVLRSRHAAAKLRFQLHLGKGRILCFQACEANFQNSQVSPKISTFGGGSI